MQLSTCFSPWPHQATGDCEISGLENDSRCIQAGDAFLAYPGAEVDGRQYIKQAIAKGAAAIVYEAKNSELFQAILDETHIPLISIDSLAPLIGIIAARFYDYPAKKLELIGITGTNGKTTIAYQLAAAYTFLGSPTAYIGTLGQGSVPNLQPLVNTTPDGLCLQKLFYSYVKTGIKRVCMEVSSHALALGRVAGLPFHQAIFTNLTREHLDFHQSMENYRNAKASLFATPELHYAILNGDDKASLDMAAKISAPGAQILYYGFQSQHAVHVNDCQINTQASTLHLTTPWGEANVLIRALGQFNIYNTLAILSSLVASGYAFQQALGVLSSLPMVPGRMEMISQEPCIIVDYAHTPDALQNVLQTLKKIHSAKLIVVFGCGGNRDQGKRPLMGKIASEYADVIIITSDNPRDEDPAEIIAAIEKGLIPGKTVYICPDRRLAIEKAIKVADKKDLIVVAGKGHETYQQIGKTRLVFSDQEVIRTLLGCEA